MRIAIVLGALILLAGAGALGAIALGLPDVAATTPHWKITRWVLSTAMENSVHRRAADIAVPGDLDDPARIRVGADRYAEMCVDCHAAPGVEAGEVADGLLPAPPKLAEVAGEWSPAELFWITDHGVRMTGMPAFGPTHSDAKIWDLVAFLRQLPRMSPAEYQALTAGAAGEHREHGHPAHPEHETRPG